MRDIREFRWDDNGPATQKGAVKSTMTGGSANRLVASLFASLLQRNCPVCLSPVSNVSWKSGSLVSLTKLTAIAVIGLTASCPVKG